MPAGLHGEHSVTGPQPKTESHHGGTESRRKTKILKSQRRRAAIKTLPLINTDRSTDGGKERGLTADLRGERGLGLKSCTRTGKFGSKTREQRFDGYEAEEESPLAAKSFMDRNTDQH
jgi:hypothetical protein